MKMEGEIVSKEYIKPSSPTPENNKTYKLSLFDQIVPPIYVPFVLYFPNPDPNTSGSTISQTSQTLKHSLSSVLSLFYPFAGRVKDTLSVDCNDEGVPFTVVKFNHNLSDFLRKPDPESCRAHIPIQLNWVEPGPGSNIAMIQVNYFACGGIAIGSLFFHKVADGVTIGTFMKSWASAVKNSGEISIFPDFKAKLSFPQNESMKREADHLFSGMRQYFKFGKTCMRRYVFDSTSISTLRSRIASPGRRPTRVETVSAFLWRCFMIACQRNGGTPSLVTHGVNMRRKAETPFPDEGFGNFVWLVPASSANDKQGRELGNLFGKVRSAISGVDSDFVRRMEGHAGFAGYRTNLEDTWKGFIGSAEYLAISSWCNFGLYDVDFGWGRPVWITKCDGGSDVEWPFFNVLWLMDTRDGDGIEAWLTLDEHYFGAFNEIEELHQLAHFDPSPMEISSFKKSVKLSN